MILNSILVYSRLNQPEIPQYGRLMKAGAWCAYHKNNQWIQVCFKMVSFPYCDTVMYDTYIILYSENNEVK